MPPVDFESDVLTRSFAIPVLVDFWASWCAPCRALAPVLEQAAERYRERFVLVKLNTEEQPEIAERYRVRGIPNVKLFVDGEAVNEFTGALSGEMLDQWLQRALPSPLRAQLQHAEQLVAQGDVLAAIALLGSILDAEPGNGRAAVLLAQLSMTSDPDRALAAIERIGPDSDVFDLVESIRTYVRLFRFVEAPDGLPDHEAKTAYLDAARHLRAGDYAAALEGFIAIVKRARTFDDDGARKACVAIFRQLGDDHELTRKYRGQLSRALYV
jgi:putative thioredoxin